MKHKRLLSLLLAVMLTVLTAAPAGAASLNVRAASALVMDHQTGEILYAKDVDTARVPASMTKVLTAYIMYQEMERGTLHKSDLVTISPAVARISRDASYPQPVPLTAGAQYSVEELLNLILIPSASASCIAIAEHISGSEAAFVARMNETAKALGLNATYTNCHGARVNYITARSMAQLVRRFILDYPDILNYTSKSSYSFRGRTYGNTNKLLSSMHYPGADGFKTGTIDAAGYCVATTASRGGRRMIAIVMKSTSTNQRFVDSRILLDYGFAEAARRDAARSTTYLTGVQAPAQAVPHVPLTVSMKIGGVSTPYACRAAWTVNGVPVEGFVNDQSQITDGKVSTLEYTPTAADAGRPLDVSFALTFADGRSVQHTVSIPMADGLNLDGQLNLKSATVYAGHSLTAEATVTTDLLLPEMEVPVQWELDGIPVAAQQTVLLSGGVGKCTATIDIPYELADERAELTCVVDPDGAQPLRLTADLRIAA